MLDPREVAAFFDRIATGWDDRIPPPSGHPAFEGFLLELAATPSAIIVEIGCGTGRALPPIASARPGALVVGIDVSAAMLREARRNLPHVLLLRASGITLPLADRSVDVVVVANTWPHLLPHPSVLAEVVRVLRHGGRFIILHTASREHINSMHRRNAAVADHLLVPVEEQAAMLERFALEVTRATEDEEHYRLDARLRPSPPAPGRSVPADRES